MGSAGQLVALLSQNVSLPPPRAATPGTWQTLLLQTLPLWGACPAGREKHHFCLQSLSTGEKKKSNNKYQSKGFLPFEGQEGEQPDKGWTCREQSRDPNPPGLEHEHFHYEILQKQNEALGARIALKFKSRCLTLPCTLGNLGGNAG